MLFGTIENLRRNSEYSVSVIYSPQEVEEAILEHEDKDLILIDTAGRSHKNAVQFSELKMLVPAKADEFTLC